MDDATKLVEGEATTVIGVVKRMVVLAAEEVRNSELLAVLDTAVERVAVKELMVGVNELESIAVVPRLVNRIVLVPVIGAAV